MCSLTSMRENLSVLLELQPLLICIQVCYSLWSSFAAFNSHFKIFLMICYSKLYPPLKISLSHSGHMFFLWYEKELNYSHALFLSDVWDKVLKRNTYLLYKVKIPICLDRGISAFSLISGKTPAYKWYSPAAGNFCYIKWKINNLSGYWEHLHFLW